MNWLYTISELIYCLHCVLYIVDSKHLKNNNNNQNKNHKNNGKNSDNNYWFNDLSDDNSQRYFRKHRITQDDIWNNYQSYQPSVDASLAVTRYETSTERPPYYLSYDSGIKTKYQAMEEELIQQQLASKSYQDDQDFEPNTRTNRYRFELPSSKISPKVSYVTRVESQIKEQHELDQNRDQNSGQPKDGKRRVGKKGLGGTFGFMMGRHFFPCDKPHHLDNDPQTGLYLIPDSLDYYHKCRYFDEDPRRQHQRKVGILGLKGFFGYFEGGRWIECPPPKRIDPDTHNPNISYIPDGIDYEPKCKYYGFNVSKLYDASIDGLYSGGQFYAKPLDRYAIVLLPFCLLILMLSYF